MNDPKDNVAVVLVSCDKYQDLWQPFFSLFQKFWSSCPFKLYLISNEKSFDYPGLTNILVGKDISWSDNLINALKQIKENFVFLWLDDLFLIDYVDTEKVVLLFQWAINSEVNYVCLNALPKPDKSYNDLVGIISPGSLYRVSTVLSLWKKGILLELLKPGETAWQFEIKGQERSDKYDHFYVTWQPVIKVVNGVIKGKWLGSAVRKLNSLGVVLDLSVRPRMNLIEELIFFFKKQRSALLQLLVPSNFRRQVRSVFLKDKP